MENFEQLPLFFEGNSRILKQLPDPHRLICKLKPTVFSFEKKGPIIVPEIDMIRTQLNALLCNVLHQNGIKTSTIATKGEFIFMEKHEVPPIEVVVKSAIIGSPKHIYQRIDQISTRFKTQLKGKHAPYVRFDWRNPLPFDDQCMPTALADYFLDTTQASQTALSAFAVLQAYCQNHDLDLLDICFFMNTAGTTICAEVSTDNCRLAYTGSDSVIAKIVNDKSKNMSTKRAKTILNLLTTL